jgi:hypothetical protein
MTNGLRPMKVYFHIDIFLCSPFSLISMFLRQWLPYFMRILRLESGLCSKLYRPPCFHLERRKPPGFSDADKFKEINLEIAVLQKSRD